MVMRISAIRLYVLIKQYTNLQNVPIPPFNWKKDGFRRPSPMENRSRSMKYKLKKDELPGKKVYGYTNPYTEIL